MESFNLVVLNVLDFMKLHCDVKCRDRMARIGIIIDIAVLMKLGGGSRALASSMGNLLKMGIYRQLYILQSSDSFTGARHVYLLTNIVGVKYTGK